MEEHCALNVKCPPKTHVFEHLVPAGGVVCVWEACRIRGGRALLEGRGYLWAARSTLLVTLLHFLIILLSHCRFKGPAVSLPLLLPCLTHDGLCVLKLWASINPSSPKLLFSWYFCHNNAKVRQGGILDGDKTSETWAGAEDNCFICPRFPVWSHFPQWSGGVSYLFSYLQEFYASKSIFSYVYSKQLMDCAISLVINREFINPGWTSAWLNILIKVIDPCVPGWKVLHWTLHS